MKNHIKIFTFFTLFCCHTLLVAQDPSFSQFYFNKLYFNPAFSGISKGIDISLSRRVLWPSIPSKFNTMKFSGDIDISSINGIGGIGLIALSDIEGEGFLRTNTFGIPVSFRPMNFGNIINSSKPRRFNFQAGFLFSVIQKSIDWDEFVFSDQFDNAKGIVKPSGFSIPYESSIMFPDISFGLVGEYVNAPYLRSHKSRWSMQTGIAFHHLTQPDFSFTGTKSELPLKQTWHMNFNFPLKFDNSFILAPALAFEKQAGMRTLSAGANILWQNPFVGIAYRQYTNFDAIAVTAGLKTGKNNRGYISYTYDYTISELMRGTGGSHEINICYVFDKSVLSATSNRNGRKKVNVVNCPFF